MGKIRLKVENIVAKGEISSFVTMFSKSCLLHRRQSESVYMRERVNLTRSTDNLPRTDCDITEILLDLA